jgi:hypothetical protein
MVEVEIRTPIYDEESETVQWARLALVRAEGRDLEIYGDASCVPPAPVMSITTGRPVEQADDPEEWARNLPYAYRTGDPAAVILRDDNPPHIEEPDSEFVEPSIPDPPEAMLAEAPTGDAAVA